MTKDLLDDVLRNFNSYIIETEHNERLSLNFLKKMMDFGVFEFCDFEYHHEGNTQNNVTIYNFIWYGDYIKMDMTKYDFEIIIERKNKIKNILEK